MSPTDRAPARRSFPALATAGLALLFSAAVLLIHPAADFSFWLDEAWSLRAVESHDAGAIIEKISADFHPPAYFLALSGWWSLAGDSERAARYPSVLCALLTIAVVYRLTLDLGYGERATPAGAQAAAALAAAALATMPFHIHFAHEARMYAPLAAGVTASMWLFWRCLARPRRATALAYVLVTAGACYIQYLAFFLVPLQVLFALARGLVSHYTNKRTLLRAAGLPIIAAAAFVPWLPTFWQQLNAPDYGAIHHHALPTDLHTITTTLAEDFFAGQSLLYLALIAAAAFTFTRAANGFRLRLRQPRALAFLALWGIGWLALVWGSNTVVPHFQPRMALPALPALAVLAGVGIARIPGLVKGLRVILERRFRLLPTSIRTGSPYLAAAIVLAALLVGNLASYDAYQAHDPHYRDAVEALARGYRPGDLVFWQTNSSFHDLPLPLYLERLLPPDAAPQWVNTLAGGWSPGSEAFGQAFAEAVGERPRFWLLQTLPVDNRWVADAVPHVEVSVTHVDAFQVALYARP